jgi:alkylation response protein AidB-like acyl-CoA dehydrogenase
MIDPSPIQLEVQATARRLAAELLAPQAAVIDASEAFPADNLRTWRVKGCSG